MSTIYFRNYLTVSLKKFQLLEVCSNSWHEISNERLDKFIEKLVVDFLRETSAEIFGSSSIITTSCSVETLVTIHLAIEISYET